MIGKVLAAGKDAGNLLRYCMGPGDKLRNAQGEDIHPHINQHTIAGNCLDLAPGASRAELAQAAADLRAYQLLNPGVTSKEGLIRHHILAANPGDRPITDQQWRAIATEYVREMYPDAKGDFRWTAINHGPNAAGADHIHIIVNRVTDSGRLLKVWQDERRCQDAVMGIEQRHGLTVLESRHADVGNHVGLPRAEIEQGHRVIRQPEREYVELTVRENALLASGPDDYLRMMREDGIDCQPWVKDGQVVGYSYRIEDGGKRAYSGKTLGRDLSWPALQATWQDQATVRDRTVAPAELAGVSAKLAAASPAEHRALSHELAGGLAAAARHETNPHRRKELTAAAKDTGAWAGRPVAGSRMPRTAITGAARAIRDLSRGPSTTNVIIAGAELVRTLLRLHRAHQASRTAQAAHEARTARHTAHAARQQAITHAKATLQPGNHYRTGEAVVRVERSHEGHIYALTPDGNGGWQKGGTDALIQASQGQRMTPRQAQDYRRTARDPNHREPPPGARPTSPPQNVTVTNHGQDRALHLRQQDQHRQRAGLRR